MFQSNYAGLPTKIRSTIASSAHRQVQSICQLLEAHGTQTPDAIAIAAPGRIPLTFGRLRSQVELTVKSLNLFGIGRNDRVAIVLPAGPEAAVAFLGVAAGATCTPLNPHYRVSEYESYLPNLNAKALIVQSGENPSVMEVARKQGIPVIKLTPVREAEAGVFILNSADHCRLSNEGFAEAGDVALVLQTSGTTSRPKLVPLTQANVYAAACAVRAALEITAADRYLNVSPLFHIQGIMLTISSILVGASVVCTPGFSAALFFQWLEEFHPTWYSAAPAVHHAILAHSRENRAIIARHPLRFIRSAASPLPPKLMAELERVFCSPVIEGYGMTECYPVTSNPLPPCKRMAGSVGIAARTEIAILDGADHLLPRGQIGEIAVAGPQVMGGYLNDSSNNENSFIDGWFRTGDQGYLNDDGYLFVTGRIKEIINRGGEKISPREVDEILLEHSAVAEAVTFAVPHSTLGEDVAAAVVLRDEASVSVREIQEFASTKLSEFKVPRQVVIVHEIPKTPTGKVQRIGLAERFGLVEQKRDTNLAPCTDVEKKLARIWASVLGLAVVSLSDNFFDLGGHSLLGAELISQIDRIFCETLPLAALLQAPTVGQMARLIQDERRPESWSSLVPIQPHGSKLPFFWVHGDASDAIIGRYLEPEQPLYALRHQSQDGTSARYTEAGTMATHYLKEIRAVQSRGPYFLGGFSFGGTVAFEMAQQLIKEGEQVALLLLLDSHFPGRDDTEILPETRPSEEARRHLRNLAALGRREKLLYVWVRIKEKVQGKIDEMTGRISKILKQRLCEICLTMGRRIPISLRSHYILDVYRKALRNYVVQSYPGRVIYIKSEKRPIDHQLSWSRLMAGGMELYEVPGDHLDIIKGPSARLWAEKLQSWLDAARNKMTVSSSSD